MYTVTGSLSLSGFSAGSGRGSAQAAQRHCRLQRVVPPSWSCSLPNLRFAPFKCFAQVFFLISAPHRFDFCIALSLLNLQNSSLSGLLKVPFSLRFLLEFRLRLRLSKVIVGNSGLCFRSDSGFRFASVVFDRLSYSVSLSQSHFVLCSIFS